VNDLSFELGVRDYVFVACGTTSCIYNSLQTYQPQYLKVYPRCWTVRSCSRQSHFGDGEGYGDWLATPIVSKSREMIYCEVPQEADREC
jgi:hypothetical protein